MSLNSPYRLTVYVVVASSLADRISGAFSTAVQFGKDMDHQISLRRRWILENKDLYGHERLRYSAPVLKINF